MSIFLSHSDRVLVQGMTGSEGQKHTRRMLSAGTKVVGGVNPRKAGTSVDFEVSPIGPGSGEVKAGTVSVPVYGTVAEGKAATGAEVSVVFVPPAFTKSAVIEAVDAGMRLVVVITEGVPVADATVFRAYAAAHGTQIIGPNCPGIISPAKSNVGITPPDITGAGPVGWFLSPVRSPTSSCMSCATWALPPALGLVETRWWAPPTLTPWLVLRPTLTLK